MCRLPLSSGELSVRSDATGGDVLPQVAGSLGAYGSQIVFLFHGYNDSFAIASQSYASFFQNFPASGNPLRDKWQPAIHSCYWPGDKSWGPVSFASYALEMGPAKQSAVVFSRFISTLHAPAGGTLDLSFIAHSLGNRVVLELLFALQTMKAAGRLSSQIRFTGFCMMAAAVPVSLVESNADLYAAATLSATRRTMYSEADTVLHLAFPVGETAAFEGFFPTAIGRYGQPESNWTAESEMFISRPDTATITGTTGVSPTPFRRSPPSSASLPPPPPPPLPSSNTLSPPHPRSRKTNSPAAPSLPPPPSAELSAHRGSSASSRRFRKVRTESAGRHCAR